MHLKPRGMNLYLMPRLPHSTFSRIPYVRFDGTMSAKQRQTVIERFSAPLTGNGITATQSSQTTPQPDIEHSSKRPSRTRKTSRRAVDGDPELDGVDADDSDFNPEDGGYDSFVDDENDAPPKTQKKGKGKASAAKGKGRATFAPLPILEEVEQIGGAVNPKVRRPFDYILFGSDIYLCRLCLSL